MAISSPGISGGVGRAAEPRGGAGGLGAELRQLDDREQEGLRRQRGRRQEGRRGGHRGQQQEGLPHQRRQVSHRREKENTNKFFYLMKDLKF